MPDPLLMMCPMDMTISSICDSDIRPNNHRLTAPINSQTETADVRKSAALRRTDMDRRRCK